MPEGSFWWPGRGRRDLGGALVDPWGPRGMPGGALEAPLAAQGGPWVPKGSKMMPKGDQNGGQKGPKSEENRSWFWALRRSMFLEGLGSHFRWLFEGILMLFGFFCAALKNWISEHEKYTKRSPKASNTEVWSPPKRELETEQIRKSLKTANLWVETDLVSVGDRFRVGWRTCRG